VQLLALSAPLDAASTTGAEWIKEEQQQDPAGPPL